MGLYLTKYLDTQNEQYNSLEKFLKSNYSGHQKLKLEFEDQSDKDASNLSKALSQCINIVELDLLIGLRELIEETGVLNFSSLPVYKINKGSFNKIVQALQNCKKMQTLRIKIESIFELDNPEEKMTVLGNSIRVFKNLQNLSILHEYQAYYDWKLSSYFSDKYDK
ncbi:hypothetical protein TTHERM_000086797 (macronuclear) [Tetrahymena thermophila SB210]|uniref:Kinase domain protein n=1 Tax=Tetrahymena thermophila (strain SB210) TaxID=312017 RepID=W7XEQ4_TETTS|nr:hypothetical protein TTHERM_000086797 [Tetrahymena thermophila SB210]EWS75223.1 hypothetical protein TTHERM_000086797 [Tetrahymena thermophila SB210]|eukprot:XP_012652214.1 hypothetical protein TTHERM_000086797 [Tetrahymena thermophila SB210]